MKETIAAPPSSGFIKDRVHYFTLRVYYDNTDAGGVVYHSEYLKFGEHARTEMLRTLDISQEKLKEKDGCVFAVSQLNLKYKAPAHLDDVLLVRTSLKTFSKVRLVLEQTLWVENKEKVRLEVELVGIDIHTWTLRHFPTFIIQKIKESLHD